MREIEFRAWNEHYQKMYDWESIGKGIFNNDDYIVMQFTGVTDKNGVKIFEGDCGYFKNGKSLMVVEWAEQGCYKIQSPKNKMYGLLFGDFDPNKFEVIGNLYENPELIYPELICA